MSVLYKSCIVRRLWAVFLGLPLLCACSLVTATDDDPTEPQPSPSTADRYINLNIVVNAGSANVMRAPQGGENGDGREAGFERENKVVGITLILYERVDDDINKSLEQKISYIKYYPVTENPIREDQGTQYGDSKKEEATYYTTGDQRLDNLDLEKKYGVIIVANYDLRQQFTKGETTVKEVCDYQMANIYGENGIAMGVNATNFIMSQEQDYCFDFSNPSKIERTENKVTYKFNDIYIERLAARMDFWAKGAEYKTSADNSSYTTPGYEYSVKDSEDKFVLTAITPFNLYDGGEYLIKRITDDTYFDRSENAPVIYLGDERVTNTNDSDHLNYVLDPYTSSKSSNTASNYMSNAYKLENVIGDNSEVKMPLSGFQSGGRWDGALYRYTEGTETRDNIIICYPKENTLWKDSYLYYYATGLCIEGDYYKDGKSTHYTYYGFLRHQGEGGSAYYAMKTREELEAEKTSLAGKFAMNFSVVRNNIYRISIESISEKKQEEDPKITLRIVVKNWDVFTHETIYM